MARSAEAVKEVLVTRSADYAGRPLTALNLATTSGEEPADILGSGHAVNMPDYLEVWCSPFTEVSFY